MTLPLMFLPVIPEEDTVFLNKLSFFFKEIEKFKQKHPSINTGLSMPRQAMNENKKIIFQAELDGKLFSIIYYSSHMSSIKSPEKLILDGPKYKRLEFKDTGDLETNLSKFFTRLNAIIEAELFIPEMNQ